MAPRLTKNVYFSIDDTQFQAEVDEVTVSFPKPIVWRSADGTTVASDTPAGGVTLKLKGVQDYDAVSGLSNFLFDNQGGQATVLFCPNAAGDAWFTVDIIVAGGQIGGPLNQFGTIDLTFDCVGAVDTASEPTP